MLNKMWFCQSTKKQKETEEREQFLTEYVKEKFIKFLESEYCEIDEGKFMCMASFSHAFLIYIKKLEGNNMPPPELCIVEQIYKYVGNHIIGLGSIKMYIEGKLFYVYTKVVGVTLTKWPRYL